MVVKIRNTIKTTNTNPRATIRSRKSILRFIAGFRDFVVTGCSFSKPLFTGIKLPDSFHCLKKISCDAAFSGEMIKAGWVPAGSRNLYRNGKDKTDEGPVRRTLYTGVSFESFFYFTFLLRKPFH